MLQRLETIETRYIELGSLLSNPKVIADQETFQRYAREHSSLKDIVDAFSALKGVEQDIAGNEGLLKGGDAELKELAEEELLPLREKKSTLEKELKLLLLPKDPNDEKNILIEIRAGAGGDEAALFAAELFRMYSRYAELHNWRLEILSINRTGLNGLKEVIALIEGQGAYSRLKYESGVHRVQRVPETEGGGRIHTSTATVAVLPEAEEVEIEINNDELRIDTFRAGGHGGQSVNKLETAVRVTHLPTGIAVSCQDEKSQHKNKQKALKILRSRLLDIKVQEQQSQIANDRKSQVGTGDRSEKIRTYNFPQNRVTDHRIGLTLHKLGQIMTGDLQEMIDHLTNYYQAEALKNSEGTT
ncbi:MAG: peptide chain release factor 1 [Deltaproteobacteria bacterium]|nr:peptide chain release factor 1 [Deltaproteobacteria bacterium]